MKLTPTRNNILAMKVSEEEMSTVSGIILPDNKKDANIFEVIEMGPEVEFALKIRGKVVAQKYSGTEVKINGDTYYLIPDIAIIAEIEE